MRSIFRSIQFLILIAGGAVLEIFPLKSLHAQESSVTILDPIVVTGSAHSTQVHQSTQSITILKAEQFSPLQPNRVATILQQVPGLHTEGMGGRSGITSLYLRGADPNFTFHDLPKSVTVE